MRLALAKRGRGGYLGGMRKFYGYDKCDTCRKALKFLKARGVEVEAIDITETPPPLKELQRAAGARGLSKLFNTSGQVYREMGLGKKLPTLSEAEALKLLASHGRLVKRPFFINDGEILVGFQEAEWKKSLASTREGSK